MEAVKAVQFKYQPLEEIINLFKTFKIMVNEAIKIGLTFKITCVLSLSKQSMTTLRPMGYILIISLVFANACSILKNHRKRKRKPYKLEGNILRIPVKPKEFITIPLKFRDYHKAFFEDKSLKRGAVTFDCFHSIYSILKERY
ncbi:MAG: hypothetical protein ACUVTD_07510 [Nitrososphaerales archaeon]